MNLDLNYYLAVFWRRFPIFIVVASLLTSIGLTLAVLLPPEYEAQAVMLVESEQIPRDLAATTVRTNRDEQLQIIEQRLMTRANLIETANRLGVYDGALRPEQPMSVTETVGDMRRRTTFQPYKNNNAQFLRIAFRAPTADLSATVTNEFVTLALRENVEIRTTVAGETLEFFEQEVERLGSEMDSHAERIIDFQSRNADALPSSLAYLQNREASLQDRVAQIDRELASQSEQRTRLIEIFERTGQLVASTQNKTPEQRALENAQRQLDDALLVYAPGNPRITMLESRVDLMKQRAAAAAGASDEGDAQQSLLETQLNDIDAKVQRLEEERQTATEELERVRASLARIPSNSNTLEALQRDRDNVRSQYNKAAQDLAVAKTGERIELLSKGQRITVIEQATPPSSPTAPNRPLIAAGGASAGVAIGLGLVVLLEFLNRSIRRPVELTTRLGIAPLAVLPYIKTERERRTKRSLIAAVVLFLVVVIPLALFLIHSFVFPLDGFVERQANRVGFSLNLGGSGARESGLPVEAGE